MILVNFLAALEATVVSTAGPTIVSDLGGMSLYSWIFTAYMLTLTVTGPLWGKLSDLYGRRGCYLTGVGIFMAGSALAGQAHSMEELILWRAVQGAGGGALTPLGQTVLAEIYDKEARAKMQALITMIFGVASVLGPAVGGWLTQHASWRAVFYLNIPFGMAGGLLLALSLPRTQASGNARLDRVGAVLFTSALTLFLLWTDRVDDWGAADPRAWGGLLVLVALLAAFLQVERRMGDDALLPLSLFANPTFRAAVVLMTLLGMALYGALTYLPLYYQGIVGQSASEAGRSLTPLLAAWILTSAVSTRLMLRIGARATIAIGVFAFLGAFLILAGAGTATPLPFLVAAATLAGLGGGFTMAPIVLAVQEAVERASLGTATSAVLFFRSVGASIGVTLMGAALGGASLSTPALLGPGLHHAFLVGLLLCGLAVAALVLCLPVPPRRRRTTPSTRCCTPNTLPEEDPMPLLNESEFAEYWRLRDMAVLHFESMALVKACELGVFTAVERVGGRPEDVARQQGLDPDITARLMEALAAMDLLTVADGVYANTPAARRFLVQGAPLDQSDMIAHAAVTPDYVRHYDAIFREGCVKAEPPLDLAHAAPLVAAMEESARIAAPYLLDRLEIGPAEKVLDLGGGAGTYSRILAERHPDLAATVMDLPAVVEAAARYTDHPRVRLVPGDFTVADLGQGYSLVLLVTTIHFLSSEVTAAMVRRAAEALAPGGRLLINDIFLSGHGDGPKREALYSLRVAMAHPGGRTHSLPELRQALAEAGLVEERFERLPPSLSSYLLARKPA